LQPNTSRLPQNALGRARWDDTKVNYWTRGDGRALSISNSMDNTISYEEAAALVANPPSLAPRPNFTNLRNLRRHIQRALQRLSCPQSNILGWAGLIIVRSMYSLLTPSPFRLSTDPGPMAVYYPPPVEIVDAQGNPILDAAGNPTYQDPPDIPRVAQSSIDAQFKRAKNYYESYLNTRRAVFNVLDDNIDDAFKVSNDLMLVGWNPLMEPREIFNQITSTYGKPTPAALLQNDTLFRSVYSPNNAPEVLFRRIEDCQEVQILGEDPYTAQQLLNNAVQLLLQCGLYTRDFDNWDRKPSADRIWINLKTFVQECYTRRLNASSITSGAQGYVQNAFTALQEESEEEDDDVQTVITQMAALTTQSQLTATTTAKTSAFVAAAIHQLHAYQQAMQQQFAAFTAQHNRTYQPAPTVQLPIMQFSIPNFATFNTAGRGGGRRGGLGRGGRTNFVNTGGRNARTPFANYVGRGGQISLPPIGGGTGRGGGVLPFTQQTMPRNAAPMYLNIIKKYSNWNVCFSCGFDVKNGHTSKTCPALWRRANHHGGFDRNNTGQYIGAGYDACTKAMHKSQIPNM
jgi:hypothetical protein